MVHRLPAPIAALCIFTSAAHIYEDEDDFTALEIDILSSLEGLLTKPDLMAPPRQRRQSSLFLTRRNDSFHEKSK